MRISDGSSDVCSSDLVAEAHAILVDVGDREVAGELGEAVGAGNGAQVERDGGIAGASGEAGEGDARRRRREAQGRAVGIEGDGAGADCAAGGRSAEHTSELQSLMRISYADFCLKHKKTT